MIQDEIDGEVGLAFTTSSELRPQYSSSQDETTSGLMAAATLQSKQRNQKLNMHHEQEGRVGTETEQIVMTGSSMGEVYQHGYNQLRQDMLIQGVNYRNTEIDDGADDQRLSDKIAKQGRLLS